MTVRKTGLIAIVIASAAISACTTTTNRFEWGGYETALYNYARNPEQRQNYKEELERTIERGRQQDKIAPGLLAELGYLHLEEGDAITAVDLFREEMRLFPESEVLMMRAIDSAAGTSQNEASS